MLRRKKQKAEEAAPEHTTAVLDSVGSAGRFFNAALGVIVIALLVATAAILFIDAQARQTLRAGQVAQAAQGLVDRLAVEMEGRQQLLAVYARNPEVRRLLLDEDMAELARLQASLQPRLPGSLRIRLLPRGWDRLDADSSPPFSYASVDILRSAERLGRVTPAEVHLLGTAQQHIALAMPVDDGSGGVAGVIHVAYPDNPLQHALRGFADLPGRIELQQVGKGSAAPLVSAGEGSADLDQQLPVPGTIWQVAYGASSAAFGDATQLIYLAILGGVLLVAVVVLGAQAKRFRQAMRHDLQSMFTLVEVLKSSTIGSVSPPKLEEFGHVFGLIRQIWQQAGRKGGGAVSAAAAEPKEMPELEGFDGPADAAGAYEEPLGELSPAIFRAYDIRGVVGDSLTERVVYGLGRAIGSEVQDQGQTTVVVARDGRHSGPAFLGALAKGLMASGCDVLDIGMVPTPVLYFATHFLGANSGVMITGSHNPPDYNGLKIVINGQALSGTAITALRQRIEQGNLRSGSGSLQEQDLLPDYIGQIVGDVQLSRPLKVVADCGNGVAGAVVPALLQALGCEVTPLFCQVDGDFPNHHPDPGKPENMRDLINTVREKQADLGVAFDGDGDRLGVVDGQGKIIWPDRLLMLLARDVLSRQPGADVIYDVKSTRHLADEILSYGGRPIMWKTGHSLIKAKMAETGALLAGEMSGHIFIKERWYGFDDGLYSCARLLELLSLEPLSVTEVFAELPESVSTPELNLPFGQEGENFDFMTQLTKLDFGDAKVVDIDGLRIEFEHGWGLVRPSNTTPSVVFRFEADTEAALEQIQAQFRQWIQQVNGALQLPF